MKTSVMLLYGGVSSEHEVSKMSAKNVFDSIDKNVYDVTLVYIDLAGRWWLASDVNGSHSDNRQVLPMFGQGQFVTDPSGMIIHPDVLLPIIHGGDGEDGKIAMLGALLHIPVVGCDETASLLCWDKYLTKLVLKSAKVPVADYILLNDSDGVSFDEVQSTFNTPFFVKPTRAGSSIGVTKVHDVSEFNDALIYGFKHSHSLLIEPYLSGRELEVAVLGNYPDHKASGVGEIISGEEFYSYDDKYDANSTAHVIPKADISDSLQKTIRRLALDAYAAAGCSGLARVDFLLDEHDNPYVNEINTFPGFTNISQYPKLWRESGVEYSDLIGQLIELAIKK